LQYHLKIIHVYQNNLTVCTLSLPDALSYVAFALTTTTHVEPAANASKHIMCQQLFEELEAIM